MGNTNIPQLSQDQWAQLGVEAFPGSWAGDPGRKLGGNFYALLKSMAANMIALNEQVRYAFLATRIDTAIDTALDNAARDFYGDDLPRLPGEEDSDYRIRIKAGFFIPYTTRQSFITALTRLLGETPRLIDPWNPSDTSAYDLSYYDVDLPEIGLPGLYGAPGKAMAYQVAIIATLPPTSLKTFGVLWGYDAGAAYDSYTAVYSPAKANQFFGPNLVDALIKRIKAAGITVWRKYLNQDLITYIVANTKQVAGDSFEFSSTILPVAGPYWVVVSGNWNSTYFVKQITSLSFVVGTGIPSPSGGGQLNTAVIPFTAHAGGIFSPTPGSYQSIVPRPANNPGARLAISPNWDTTLWISKEVGNNLIISSQNPSPAGGNVQYAFLPDNTSWYVTVEAGSPGCTINTPDFSGVPFCLPSWNTQVAVEMRNGIISATFNVDAPANAYVHIGYFRIGSNIYDVDAPPPPQPGPIPNDVTGSGSFTLPSLELSGSGIQNLFGTGSFTLPALELSGSGVEGVTGTGSFALPALELSGAGTVTAGSVFAPPADITYPGYFASAAGELPSRIVVSPDGAYLYVMCYKTVFAGDTVVIKIDTATGSIVAESAAYANFDPTGCHLSSDGSKLFCVISDSSTGSVSVLRLQTSDMSQLSLTALGVTARDFDVSSDDSKMALIRNNGTGTVIIFDLSALTNTTFNTGSAGTTICFLPGDATHVYVVNNGLSIKKYTTAGVLNTTFATGLSGGGNINIMRAHPTSGSIYGMQGTANRGFIYDTGSSTLIFADGSIVLNSSSFTAMCFDAINTVAPYKGYMQNAKTAYRMDSAGGSNDPSFVPTTHSGYDSLAADGVRGVVYTTSQGTSQVLHIQTIALP